MSRTWCKSFVRCSQSDFRLFAFTTILSQIYWHDLDCRSIFSFKNLHISFDEWRNDVHFGKWMEMNKSHAFGFQLQRTFYPENATIMNRNLFRSILFKDWWPTEQHQWTTSIVNVNWMTRMVNITGINEMLSQVSIKFNWKERHFLHELQRFSFRNWRFQF